jgi:hypothetical protein
MESEVQERIEAKEGIEKNRSQRVGCSWSFRLKEGI